MSNFAPKDCISYDEGECHHYQQIVVIFLLKIPTSGHKNERRARKNMWNLKLPFLNLKDLCFGKFDSVQLIISVLSRYVPALRSFLLVTFWHEQNSQAPVMS